MKRTNSDKALLIMRIIVSILLIAILAFLSYVTVDTFLEDRQHAGESGYFSGYGFIVFIVILFSLIGNGVCLLLSLIGILLAFILKHQTRQKKNRILSFVFAIFPFLNEALILILLTTLGKM